MQLGVFGSGFTIQGSRVAPVWKLAGYLCHSSHLAGPVGQAGISYIYILNLVGFQAGIPGAVEHIVYYLCKLLLSFPGREIFGDGLAHPRADPAIMYYGGSESLELKKGDRRRGTCL